ncbi:hypothetical protein HPULCUR_006139 [Helicostylum pulchrum]|uniref:Uncharacterized protein n=1 Tax=Helicostylum pulchrum TaxID=562976 RepID=A0ABP9Y1R3_9FUNG
MKTPRSDDVTPINNSTPSSVKRFLKSTHTHSAFVSVSHITTSAEITIPIPLFSSKRQQSFSSMSSSEDHASSSQLPPLNNEKKKYFFIPTNNSDEYASSPGSESDILSLSRTPPHSSSVFAQRFANSPPPAGSGAKFMRKSKRTSLIVDGQTDSIPPNTPISLPESIKFNNNRNVVIDKRLSGIDDNKSGSISKLRENRLPSPKLFEEAHHIQHNRNSSISSILTDNISNISSDGYESSNDYDSMSNKCEFFLSFFSVIIINKIHSFFFY